MHDHPTTANAFHSTDDEYQLVLLTWLPVRSARKCILLSTREADSPHLVCSVGVRGLRVPGLTACTVHDALWSVLCHCEHYTL
jgi:hypothetical protein